MKITLNVAEALELQKVVKKVQSASQNLNVMTGEKVNDLTEEEENLQAFFKECPFAKISVHILGVTVDIDPKFIGDLCYIYKEYIDGTLECVMPLIKKLMKLDEMTKVVMSKWVE